MLTLSKYATISVPIEIKKRLEQAKGEKEWGEFLLEMCTEGQHLERQKSLRRTHDNFSLKQDLKAIRESSKEFQGELQVKMNSTNTGISSTLWKITITHQQ